MKINENKGFTLVELLAIIVIIGVMATVGIVSVTRLIDRAKKEKNVQQEKIVLIAAKSYFQDNRKELPTSGIKKIYISKLYESKYLNEQIIEIDGKKCVAVTKVDGKTGISKYEYSIVSC